MKEIKPTYITFEQAKWLKEKGFDQNINNAWFNRVGNYLGICNVKEDGTQVTYSNTYSSSELVTREYYNECCSYRYCAPEQWQVVEWLRVKHDICLWVKPYADSITYQPHWCYINNKAKENNNTFHLSGNASINGSDYNSPQEAYSAAFDYIKDNNLI
jgi:hypothetical protein